MKINIKKRKNEKEKKRKFAIGLRTIKTIIAVFIAGLLYKVFDKLDLFMMATTAIISMKPTKEKTLTIGFERVLGTIIGGMLSLILLLVDKYIPFYESFTYLIVMPLCILVLILICNKINQSESIGISSIVFLRIITGISKTGANVFLYVTNAVISSIIGVTISLFLNSIEKYQYKEIELEAEATKDIEEGKELNKLAKEMIAENAKEEN